MFLLSRVKYENGQITEGPTACAGNQGTTITFEDIFYNSPIRLKTLGFPSDEFLKIYDVVAKYAVHNHQISFTLKKFNETNSIKTLSSPSPVDAIRSIYSNNVANSLLEINCADKDLKFTMNGFISNVDFSGKKRNFLLFINHRLVDSKSLKKAIFDEVYNKILPNNVQPFVYVSLEMDPMNLDVNVSPTKHEVNFLNEDAIVERIKTAVEDRILGMNETRKLYTQPLLPGASAVTAEKSFDEMNRSYPKDMVRTDEKSQTIVKFFQPEVKSSSQGYHSQSPKAVTQISSPVLNRSKSHREKSVTKLSSINDLKAEVLETFDEGLRTQIEKLNFVGIASRAKALVQCENILYLAETRNLCQELFYQQAILNFENFELIEFDEPISIKELAMIALTMKDCEYTEDDGDMDELAARVETTLMNHRQLLKEYFGVTINIDGELETLPSLISSYLPLMSHLPLFIVRLATDVDYSDEKQCFKSICTNLATYYSRLSLTSSDRDFRFLSQTVIFPEIRKRLLPPAKFLNDATLLKLTSLQELYKVFERC
jgi:DNA mismatch repair protein MLH1